MFSVHPSCRPWAAIVLLVVDCGACAPLRPAPEAAAPRVAIAPAPLPDCPPSAPAPASDSLPANGLLPATPRAWVGCRPRAAHARRTHSGHSGHYGPATGAPTAQKAAVAAAPQAPARSTWHRRGLGVRPFSACRGGLRRGARVVVSAPPTAHPMTNWGGAPRSVERAVALSGGLALLAAGLGWLLWLGRRWSAR